MQAFESVRWVLIYTMVLNLLVSALKLAVAYATGSLAILANGLDSIFDSSTNVMGLIAISLARRPPDEDHPYGHRRYETLMTLGVSLLLFITCYTILHGAYQRLRSPPVIDVNVWSFASLVVGMVLHWYTSRYEMRRGRELKSDFLLADASHTRADILVTAGVIVGLIVVKAGYPVVDAIAAMIIAGVIAKIGIEIIRSSTRILTDSAALETARVAAILEQVPGVQSYHHIRSRGQEDDVHLDLHIRVAPDMPLAQAHLVAHEAQRRLQGQLEGIRDVIIHVEPQPAAPGSADNDVSARVREVARAAGATIHHVNTYEAGGRYAVDLHLEVPGELPLGEAHTQASVLEQQIRAMIPEVSEITTHIEPTVAPRTRSEALPEDAATEQTARELALAVPGVRQCQEVRMLRAGGGLLLSIRCALDEDLTTIQAHDISTIIEEHVKRQCPDVDGVFVHVEPLSGETSSSHG